MKVKKLCELCNNVATICCESDQASLCLECDSKVHGANFLVAKHVRSLLCHVCQSPTLWSGSGPKLGPIMSLCQTCHSNSVGNNKDSDHMHGRLIGRNNNLSNVCNNNIDEDGDDGDHTDDEDDSGDDEDHDDHSSEEEEDDEDIQVVPWSYSGSRPR